MTKITQADMDRRNAIYKELTGLTTPQPEASQYDWMDKYLAAHRIDAAKASDVALATAYQCGYDTAEVRTEKAVLDRLRNLPDDVALAAIARVPDYEGTHRTARYVQNTATALADALETK